MRLKQLVHCHLKTLRHDTYRHFAGLSGGIALTGEFIHEQTDKIIDSCHGFCRGVGTGQLNLVKDCFEKVFHLLHLRRGEFWS